MQNFFLANLARDLSFWAGTLGRDGEASLRQKWNGGERTSLKDIKEAGERPTKREREKGLVGWARGGETEETREYHGLICRIEKEGTLFKEILQHIHILLETAGFCGLGQSAAAPKNNSSLSIIFASCKNG